MKKNKNNIVHRIENKQNIIIYNTADGKVSVSLYAKDGTVWMNQKQIAGEYTKSCVKGENMYNEKKSKPITKKTGNQRFPADNWRPIC